MTLRRKVTPLPTPGSFPARAVIVDANALIRFYKSDGLTRLPRIKLVIADWVHSEFRRGGPSQRAALARMNVVQQPIQVGSPEWQYFTRVRERMGTRDIGEDASLAIALARADRGEFLPFVVFDDRASRKAREHKIATLSFLETLAWLVSCGVATIDDAERIEQRAAVHDGWRRPTTQAGPLAEQIATLVTESRTRIEASRTPTRKRRR